MAETKSDTSLLLWKDLSVAHREALSGRLTGLWGAPSDEAAFDNFAVEKQQALLITLSRLLEKELWQVVKKIENVYGEGGVGIKFFAWPFVLSTLKRRKDFTRLMANHKDTTGGFYEKGRADAVLHFLYQDGNPQTWYVHFDLYSPVHSPVSAWKHMRYEFIGKVRPDWRMIQDSLNA